MFFVVLLALGLTKKHGRRTGYPRPPPEKWPGLHYSRFSPISADRLLAAQLLAGRKIENLATNWPSQAKVDAIGSSGADTLCGLAALGGGAHAASS